MTCDPTDPVNWTDFTEAAAAARRTGYGLGFVFSDNDPFWFLDIDKAFDGQSWSPLATSLYHMLQTCAVEVSPSGKGMHIIGSGKLAEHGSRGANGLELYHTARFATVTGQCYPGGSAASSPAAIHTIAAQYFPPTSSLARASEWTDQPRTDWAGPDDDDELIKRALRSKTAAVVFGQGVTFKDLWTADADQLAKRWPGNSEGGYDASAADGSLAAMLSWWTGCNHERTERIMQRSALARGKWDRSSAYLEPTILRAAAQLTSVYCEPTEAPPPPPIEAPPLGHVSPSVDADQPAAPGRILALTAAQARDKSDSLTIEYWLAALQQRPAFDEFSNVLIMADGQRLTDHTERQLWIQAREVSGLKFAWDLFGAVLRNLAYGNRFHPVRDYLDLCAGEWDGTNRLDTWLTELLGVPASPYTSAVGRLWLTAACRRIRQPGAKFDEIPVLEGEQGTLKSSAMATLMPVESWFTDDLTLAMNSKEILEATEGKWIVEAPELSRMGRADVQHVRAMLSRQFDRARPAYGRNVEERGRQFVAFATTNDNKYLAGFERRFWPLVTGDIDLSAIAGARTQLWAEASLAERAGASVRLDRSLWAAARVEQDERVQDNPLRDRLSGMLLDMTGRVRGTTLLEALHIPIERQQNYARQLGEAMKDLGWENKAPRIDGDRIRFYVRGDPAREIKYFGGVFSYVEPELRAVQ